MTSYSSAVSSLKFRVDRTHVKVPSSDCCKGFHCCWRIQFVESTESLHLLKHWEQLLRGRISSFRGIFFLSQIGLRFYKPVIRIVLVEKRQFCWNWLRWLRCWLRCFCHVPCRGHQYVSFNKIRKMLLRWLPFLFLLLNQIIQKNLLQGAKW